MTRLEGLNVGDDVALPSHNHQGVQSKVTRMVQTSAKADLRIIKSKTNGMKINTRNAARLELDGCVGNFFITFLLAAIQVLFSQRYC